MACLCEEIAGKDIELSPTCIGRAMKALKKAGKIIQEDRRLILPSFEAA
ncbi:MAG: hypothetical protein WAO07_13305 [Desulfobacterales bacterium]